MKNGCHPKIKKLIPFTLPLLGVLSAAAFSPLFLFFRNAGEAHFRDVAPTMLMFMAGGLVLFALVCLLMRQPAGAGLVSVLFLLVFLNYAPLEGAIQTALPSLRYWHIAPTLLVLLLHVGWFIWKKLPRELAELIMSALAVVFAGLILFNGLLALPAMSTRIRAEREAERLAGEAVETDGTMPNFYFLLFDEFSTIPFMQKYFGYDNSALLEELEQLGFSVSQSGHNESAETATVTANLFHLDYVVSDEDSEEARFAKRSNNVVFPLLKEFGYSIVGVGDTPFYGLPDAVDEKPRNAATAGGETAHTLLMNMTALYPRTTQYYPAVPAAILEDLAYLKKPENFQETNQFVLSHIVCPHPPFYFNADGSISDNITSKWSNPDSYLNQYRFISDEIVEITGSIIANDPHAVIWVLSDHGARASTDPDHERFPDDDMRNFFSALYFQGESVAIEGLSGVNTFRLILNRLLGTDYERVPLPEPVG